ncbi:MAG: hypothetical protein ACRETL_11600 [Gammaproteobacteria bacterium]
MSGCRFAAIVRRVADDQNQLMLKQADIACGLLLLVGAALHTYGSLTLAPWGSELQVWALSGSLAAALVAILNLVRTTRPDDALLAAIALGGSLCWAAIACGFGQAIGHPFDMRVLWHALTALALAGFSLRQILNRQTQT